MFRTANLSTSEGIVGRVTRERRWTGGAYPLTVLRVAAASGLTLDVLPDRCCDIGAAAFRGVPIAWLRGTPFRHPADLPEKRWAALFVGGLLATCGLDNVGPACQDEGQLFPQHGTIAGQPAYDLRCGTRRIAGRRFHWLAATIAQPGAPLRLRRRIIVPDDQPVVRITDTVRNGGDRPEPLMIQYHCNFGAPFVAPGGRVVIPNTTVLPRDASAAAALKRWEMIEAPRADEVERVFRHEQRGKRWARASLLPPDPRAVPYALHVRADRRTLPWLWQWRLLGAEDYVIGLEPANVAVKPRDAARAHNALPHLGSGQRIRFVVAIAVLPYTPTRDRDDACLH